MKGVSLIAAVDSNWTIGLNPPNGKPKLPWHYKADLQNFRRLTLGDVLLCGATTYRSLPGPLPMRDLVVVSHQPPPGDCFANRWAPGWTEAVEAAGELALARSLERPPGDPVARVWVIGGAAIYERALADKLPEEVIITGVPEALSPDEPHLVRFPYQVLAAHYEIARTEQLEADPRLRITTWRVRP